jgi:hypothetical protein
MGRRTAIPSLSTKHAALGRVEKMAEVNEIPHFQPVAPPLPLCELSDEHSLTIGHSGDNECPSGTFQRLPHPKSDILGAMPMCSTYSVRHLIAGYEKCT